MEEKFKNEKQQQNWRNTMDDKIDKLNRDKSDLGQDEPVSYTYDGDPKTRTADDIIIGGRTIRRGDPVTGDYFSKDPRFKRVKD